MPTAAPTIQRPVAYVRADISGNFSRHDDGKATLSGLKIFRAGTFKDSLGEQRTWSSDDLHGIVANFEMLRDADIHPNVPVRKDHTRSVEDVVGYLADLSTDGEYLYATLEFTEPDAADKWERGTYRARSLEVGPYEDNDGQIFYPVAHGLAFVDRGAVEGLHAAEGDLPKVAIDDTKENTVTEEEFKAACEYAAWEIAAEYAQWEIAATYAQDVDDVAWTAAAYFAQGVEDGKREQVAAHEAGDKAPMTYQLFGAPSADVNEVQRHISALEGTLAEQSTKARTDFVSSLVDANKIAAPQREGLLSLALSLDDTQYAAFVENYEGAPAAPLFATFESGSPSGDPTTQTADEIDLLTEQVAMHRRGGMPTDQIHQLDSFKRLEALKAEK